MTEEISKLTEDQAKTLYDANAKDLSLENTGYYKLVFNFEGSNDSIDVLAYFGGSADEVYKYEPPEGKFPAPTTFENLKDSYHMITIIDKKTNAQYEWNSW